MRSRDEVSVRELQAAERDVATADAALWAGVDRLKGHAGRAGSYSAPLGAFGALGALVAFKLLWRAAKRGSRRSPVATSMPARAGIAALLLRLALPGIVGFVREHARAWQAPAADRSGSVGRGPGGARARAARPLPRVSASLDRARFAGRWFEVAHLSGDGPGDERVAGGGQASMVLVPVPDGFAVERATVVAHGRHGSRVRVRSGVLRRTGPSARASELSLSFAPSWARWAPSAWHDYWILEVDTAYTFALVGDRARSALTVLSRSPSLGDVAWNQLLATAAEEGYPVEHLSRAAEDRGV
jgi:apolipoprotein D and lipocalin family protein